MRQIRKIESLRSLAELFSNSLMSKAIIGDRSDLLSNRIRKHFFNIPVGNGCNYSDFFKSLYQELSLLYANEYIFKNTILNAVRRDDKYKDSVILDEFTIGKSIADMVIINGKTEIYEIKTLLDKPDRLGQQLKSYYQAVTLVNVVIHKSELDKYMIYLGSDPCGILVNSVKNGLERIRKPEAFSDYLNHTTLFKLLRKNEFLQIINNSFKNLPDLPNTEIFRYCLSRVNELDIKELQKLTFQILKLRKENIDGFFGSHKIPDEFAYVSYQINLNSITYNRFSQFLDKKIN